MGKKLYKKKKIKKIKLSSEIEINFGSIFDCNVSVCASSVASLRKFFNKVILCTKKESLTGLQISESRCIKSLNLPNM